MKLTKVMNYLFELMFDKLHPHLSVNRLSLLNIS